MSVAINSSPAGALIQNNLKRRASDDENERQSDSKKAKYAWYFTLESESPIPTEEDEESTYTFQGYETECARDTEDTSTHTWVTSDSNDSDVSVHVEYELESTENEASLSAMSTSSEPENILAIEFVTACESQSTGEDSDVSRCSIDSGFRRSVFRNCVQCKNPNNNSLYPYCLKCYQERKTYFPRPRRKRKQRAIKKINSTTTTATASSQELFEMDSGIASSQYELDSAVMTASSQELDNKFLSCIRSNETSLALDSQGSELSMSSTRSLSSPVATTTFAVSSTNSSQERDEVDSGVTSKDEKSDDHMSSQDSGCCEKEYSKSGLMRILSQKQETQTEEHDRYSPCRICFKKPSDAFFAHGKTAHVYCCYSCAKKVCMSKNNRCPVCKRRVSRIFRFFY